MTPTDLCTLVTAFFVTHLAGERNVSAHTTAAYRDALTRLLRFAADFHDTSARPRTSTNRARNSTEGCLTGRGDR